MEEEIEKRAKEYLEERGMQGGVGGALIPNLLARFARREIMGFWKWYNMTHTEFEASKRIVEAYLKSKH